MTTAFDTELAKQEGARPRALLQIDLPVAGTIYLSDQEITLGGHTYRPLVQEWGNILIAEDTTGGFDLVVLNHNDPVLGRFSDYRKTNILTNAPVRLYKWFAGLAAADMQPDFKGVIDDYSYNLTRLTLSINDGTHQEHKDLPVETLNYLEYTNARQEDIGKFFPLLYGECGEELDIRKINKGYGSAPTLLINKAQKKYLAAGHISYNAPTTVWCGLSGISDGYAYMEGCVADTDDGGYTTITLPANMMAGYYLASLASGSYFTYTAQNPQNVCGRDAATTALLNATYPLLGVMVDSVGELGTIARVKISTSPSHPGCRTRWAGPKSKLYEACGSGATSIKIDSGAGFDQSGTMEINADQFTYTSVTEDPAGAFWTVGGVSGITAHSVNDPVVMVGPWRTLSTASIDVTADRDWSRFDFYKFEIVIEWQSGADYTPSFVGFRIEFELKEYPDVYVPGKGYALTNRRNAIEQVKHLYTEHLGRSAGDIGDTFTTAIADLVALGYKTDFSVNDEISSKDLIMEILKECKARFWLDGEGKPQVKVFKFGESAGRFISYDVDIIDPDGSDFTVRITPIDEVYNEVYVRFCKDYASGNYTKEYYITPAAASPSDSGRVADAAQSKTDFNTTNRLTMECPYIQDESTALDLLQYLFDYYHRQRSLYEFTVSLKQYAIQMADILWVSHPLVPAGQSVEVIKTVRSGNVLKITVREYGTEVVFNDLAILTDSIVSRQHGQGFGKDGFGVKFGGDFTTL